MPKFYQVKTGKIVETSYYKEAADVGGLARVSEVSKFAPNNQLVRWQIETAVDFAVDQCARQLPQTETSLRCIKEEAAQYANDVRDKAAEDGTAIHAILENPYDRAAIKEAVKAVGRTVVDKILHGRERFMQALYDARFVEDKAEFVVIDRRLGYGGRCDLRMRRGQTKIYIDWKTQSVKPSKNGTPTPKYYDSWVIQLAAYAAANSVKFPTGASLKSVVVDRNTGMLYDYDWSPEDARWGLRCFRDYLQAYYTAHRIDIKSILKQYRKDQYER